MKYLFDFDGTLVDSMPTWAGTHINALKRGGIPCPADFVKTITPLGNLNASKYTISLGLDVSLEDYLERLNLDLSDAYLNRIVAKDNALETLNELKARGHSVNVLTASPHKYVDPCLKRNGLYDLFDEVWSIDDFGLTKSEVAIYQQAAERLGVAIDECVMVDDNITAIETSKAAGMHTVAMYDLSAAEFAEQMKQIADLYITDFKQML